jgi:hypothetical protein
MAFLRRLSMPEAWLLLGAGLCLLAAVGVDVAYVAVRNRGRAPAAVEAKYPLPAVTGELRLRNHGTQSLSRAAAAIGVPCKGLGAYNDLFGGTQVVVKDQLGAVIATGSLDVGRVVPGRTCQFGVLVPELPRADVYQFEVGQRLISAYRYDDLAASGWQVTLNLS